MCHQDLTLRLRIGVNFVRLKNKAINIERKVIHESDTCSSNKKQIGQGVSGRNGGIQCLHYLGRFHCHDRQSYPLILFSKTEKTNPCEKSQGFYFFVGITKLKIVKVTRMPVFHVVNLCRKAGVT